jgi:hypothetical protein
MSLGRSKGAGSDRSKQPHGATSSLARPSPGPCGASVGKYLSLPVSSRKQTRSSGEVLVYERELTRVKGMEDMSDLEGLRSIKRNRCS